MDKPKDKRKKRRKGDLKKKKKRKIHKADRKTILFSALDCTGHINSLISIANDLKNRGHKTVFLFPDPVDFGLIEAGHIVYDCVDDEDPGALNRSSPDSDSSEEKWNLIVKNMSKAWRSKNLLDAYKHQSEHGLGAMLDDIKAKDDIVALKLELIKPDFIIIDHYAIQPALLKYGKPWARVHSASPLGLHPTSHKLPPAYLGLSTNWLDAKPNKKAKYVTLASKALEFRKQMCNNWRKYLLEEHNLDVCSLDPVSFIPVSPYLNVYMYPKELDYEQSLEPEWQQCDSILRANNLYDDDDDDMSFERAVALEEEQQKQRNFLLSSWFLEMPGPLIYVSMGTLASAYAPLMRRLVRILSNKPYRVIMSRGPNWRKYDLAYNICGMKNVPQLAVLPIIDLIITHGGNNTITECLYYGVPGYIVCPVFGDQKDNAQRIEESKLGKQLNPFHCSEERMLATIDEVINDATIKPRAKAISKRMQLPESKFKALKIFRNFVEG